MYTEHILAIKDDLVFFNGQIIEVKTKEDPEFIVKASKAYEWLKQQAAKLGKNALNYLKHFDKLKLIWPWIKRIAKEGKNVFSKLGLGKLWNFIESQVKSVVNKVLSLLEKEAEKEVEEKSFWKEHQKEIIGAIVLLLTFGIVSFIIVKVIKDSSEKNRKRQPESHRPTRDAYNFLYNLYATLDNVVKESKVQNDGVLNFIIGDAKTTRRTKRRTHKRNKTLEAVINFLKDIVDETRKEIAKIFGKVLAFLIVAPILFAIYGLVALVMCHPSLRQTTAAKIYLTTLQTIYRQLKFPEPKTYDEFCRGLFRS